ARSSWRGAALADRAVSRHGAPGSASAPSRGSAHGRRSLHRLGPNGVLLRIGVGIGFVGILDEAGPEISLDAGERLLGPVGEAQLVGGMEVGQHFLQLTAGA